MRASTLPGSMSGCGSSARKITARSTSESSDCCRSRPFQRSPCGRSPAFHRLRPSTRGYWRISRCSFRLAGSCAPLRVCRTGASRWCYAISAFRCIAIFCTASSISSCCLVIVGACWAYQRGLHALAGALVAIAAACKIFPVVLFVFFLRRGSWRALIAGAATGAVALAVSVAVFGWNLHRTYLHQILPWSLHGEGLPPYATASASISSVLHYLFLAEPQWNPHPWHNSPLCYALLQPTLQMLALAPAVLLIRRSDRTPGRIALEWSALITASLAISTSPASLSTSSC